MNFYTVKFSGGLLGYATFPSNYAREPVRDGIVDDYRTLPGGAYTNYNNGNSE